MSDALERLKALRNKSRETVPAAPAKFSAAESHHQNDKYMADFEVAWQDMHGLSISHAQHGPPDEVIAGVSTCTDFRSTYPSHAVHSWMTGPIDQAGLQVDLSDRPTVCSASNWDQGEVVVGSTDHALYVVDVESGTKKRQLHSKSSGHAEWVTCATYLNNGSILSGGMDSTLCLWQNGSTRCSSLRGHSGPISKVACDESSGVAVSASYDKALRLWDCGGARFKEAATLTGHAAPVLEMEVNNNGQVVSGDRSGNVLLWDLATGGVTWRMKGVHRGHVTALAWMDSSGGNSSWSGCFASGGQDGYLRVWDPRSCSNPVKLALHVNTQGHGALGNIIAGGAATCHLLVTAGADGTVRAVDPRGKMSELAKIELTDFPYSCTAVGGLVVTGCGDGSVHVIDTATLDTVYALGVSTCAIRTIDASSNRLVCSGDDGNATVYHFL